MLRSLFGQKSVRFETALFLPLDDLVLEEKTQLHQPGVKPHRCVSHDGSAPASHQLCGTGSPQTGGSQCERAHAFIGSAFCFLSSMFYGGFLIIQQLIL